MGLPTIEQIKEAQARHPEIMLVRGTFGFKFKNKPKCCCPFGLLALDSGLAHFMDVDGNWSLVLYGPYGEDGTDPNRTLRKLFQLSDAEIAGFARGVDGEPYACPDYDNYPAYAAAWHAGRGMGAELFGDSPDYDNLDDPVAPVAPVPNPND